MLIADAPPAYTSTAVTYPDGAVAEARPECSVLDLCATITLPDKDVLRIYNKGSGRCQPFVLHLVRTHGDAVLLDSELVTATTESAPSYTQPNTPQPQPSPSAASKRRLTLPSQHACAQFKNTYFTFDEGRIRMGVFLAKDGSLFVQFSPPK
jgi:hypothetical protein